MSDKKKRGTGIPETPAIMPDSRKDEGGAPIADDQSVKEAKDWVDYNKL